MAGYPPPYPPPYGLNAKQQARFARQQFKAQLRAQKQALRAQRDLYRYQSRGLRRSSILGPLIILAAGIVTLLVQTGRVPFVTFWFWYQRWWPLLLVGGGVVLVAEWAFDQIPRADGTPYGRRRIGGGAIFLLLVLAVTGATLHEVHDGRTLFANHFGIDSDTLDQFFGEKHEMTQQVESAFPAGSSLSIDNPHGDVTIVGKSEDDKVHITVNKQVYSQSDSDADSKAQSLSPQIYLTGGTLSVSMPAINGAISDLSITVPSSGETTVSANHGDVAVSGIHAPVHITANHGDVDVNSITGVVSAHINHRDSSLSAHGITGDLTIRGHAQDLNVSEVSGQVWMEGEFYGDTHLEHLGGATSFHTSRTQLSVARLDGEIDISPRSDLTGDQIAGPIQLKTRSRNITLDRIAGDVEVVDSDGHVDITSALPLGNVSVTNRNGEVNLTLPEHTGFAIDAETKGGEIESDLGLKPVNSEHLSVLQGTVGAGGPTISIHTTHLDIGIHKAEASPLTPPAPSAVPKAPKTAIDPGKPRV